LLQVEHALQTTPDDVAALLKPPNFQDLSDPILRDIWKDVVRLAAGPEGLAPQVSAVALTQASGDADLEDYLRKLDNPKRPDWEVKEERRQRAQAKARDRRWADHRRDFGAHQEKVRAGELSWIVPPGRAYFGRYSDMSDDLEPMARIADWLGDELQAAVREGFDSVLRRTDLPCPQAVSESYAESRRWNVIDPLLAALCERVANSIGLTDLSDNVLLIGRIGLVHEHIEEKHGGRALEAELDGELKARPGLFERYARLLIEPQLRAGQSHIRGLYQLCRPKAPTQEITALAVEWLDTFPSMDLTAEDELVNYLFRAGAIAALLQAAAGRRHNGFRDEEQRLAWLATEWLIDFDARREELDHVAASNSQFLWYLRNRTYPDQFESDTAIEPTRPKQLAWVFRTFREAFPLVQHPTGSSTGNTNPWDATDFLAGRMHKLATDTSDAAIGELELLLEATEDGYTPAIRNARAEQLKARRETDFTPTTLPALAAVVGGRAPKTIADLQALALDALEVIQAQLRGDALDRVGLFYGPAGPLDENACRNRLAILLERQLPYGISAIPERRMPNDKRADLALLLDDLQLPIEAKGQWHRELWTAADLQLDHLYTRDWRAGGCGIYLVFWFGADIARPRHLQAPAEGIEHPTTAAALKRALTAQIPAHRRGSIDVVVLDLSR
jgi:hypothetical protein